MLRTPIWFGPLTTIIYWNKSAELLYGWGADQGHWRNALELLFKDVPPEYLDSDILLGEWRVAWRMRR